MVAKSPFIVCLNFCNVLREISFGNQSQTDGNGFSSVFLSFSSVFFMFFIFFAVFPNFFLSKSEKNFFFLFVRRVAPRDEIASHKAKPIFGEMGNCNCNFSRAYASVAAMWERGNDLKCFCWFVSALIAFNLSILLNFPLRLIKRNIHA